MASLLRITSTAVVLAAMAGCGGSTTDGEADQIEAQGPLEIRFLGVGGFLIRYGGDAILTPPLYSNPNILATVAGTAKADRELIDRLSQGQPLDEVDAILVGHAHYDHLMDLPYIWPKTDNAWIFGNRTMRHLLGAYAPDRPPQCAGVPAQDVQIPRDRVVQLDDPLGVLEDHPVDYRMCPDQWNGEGAESGGWVHVEGTNVRFRPLCSHHPDQFGSVHFGEGSIGADLCAPPKQAETWREGATLAYLIDFLEPATGEPLYRLYYQDAPTEAPIGHASPDLLEEKAVDVAMLCVGNFAQVSEQPGAILRSLTPRYSVGGHWEDFFRTQDQPIRPLPFHDMSVYSASAIQALGDHLEPEVVVNGEAQIARQWLPQPGTTFLVPPRSAGADELR